MTRRRRATRLALLGGLLAAGLTAIAVDQLGPAIALGTLAGLVVVLSALVLGGTHLAVFAVLAVLAVVQFATTGHLHFHVGGRSSHHGLLHTTHWGAYWDGSPR